ncbi:MAG TPA: hypothetical protein VKE23_12890 [Candidatus Limnocylindria bacterium]|nr:hypothetical protein [Candidatus Limnocylindria bacterium]
MATVVKSVPPTKSAIAPDAEARGACRQRTRQRAGVEHAEREERAARRGEGYDESLPKPDKGPEHDERDDRDIEHVGKSRERAKER